jgi:hypothetical protein
MKLVLIEWIDSSQPVPAWHFLSDLPDMEPIRCISVGWLVCETAEVKMLAPNVGNFESEDNKQASGFIRIPTRCITRQSLLVESLKET